MLKLHSRHLKRNRSLILLSPMWSNVSPMRGGRGQRKVPCVRCSTPHVWNHWAFRRRYFLKDSWKHSFIKVALQNLPFSSVWQWPQGSDNVIKHHIPLWHGRKHFADPFLQNVLLYFVSVFLPSFLSFKHGSKILDLESSKLMDSVHLFLAFLPDLTDCLQIREMLNN